jgi:hypothetical protein
VLRLPPQPLVLLHDEQVLQAQARVHSLHLFLQLASDPPASHDAMQERT